MTTDVPTRERIVNTAARLFLARSYQVVGVKEICLAAQVQNGSFYHYFPSKCDLAVAVVDHHAAGFWRALEQRERARRGPVGKIRASAEVVADIHAENTRSVRVAEKIGLLLRGRRLHHGEPHLHYAMNVTEYRAGGDRA